MKKTSNAVIVPIMQDLNELKFLPFANSNEHFWKEAAAYIM